MSYQVNDSFGNMVVLQDGAGGGFDANGNFVLSQSEAKEISTWRSFWTDWSKNQFNDLGSYADPKARSAEILTTVAQRNQQINERAALDEQKTIEFLFSQQAKNVALTGHTPQISQALGPDNKPTLAASAPKPQSGAVGLSAVAAALFFFFK